MMDKAKNVKFQDMVSGTKSYANAGVSNTKVFFGTAKRKKRDASLIDQELAETIEYEDFN
jgi:hypothetical protein